MAPRISRVLHLHAQQHVVDGTLQLRPVGAEGLRQDRLNFVLAKTSDQSERDSAILKAVNCIVKRARNVAG